MEILNVIKRDTVIFKDGTIKSDRNEQGLQVMANIRQL